MFNETSWDVSYYNEYVHSFESSSTTIYNFTGGNFDYSGLDFINVQNLFVVSVENFAHNSGYNPTATVGALAYRTAEGIQKYQ